MPDPRSTPAPDDAVRRLLAQARHDAPVPEHVALRLDRVLDALRAETVGVAESGSSPDAPVASLDGWHHRRRTTVRLLVAAAAVLVVGGGVAHYVGHRESPSDSAASSASVQQPVRGSGSAPAAEAQSGSRGYAQIESRLPVPLTSTGLAGGARGAARLVARLDPSLQDAGPLAAALAEPLPGWVCGTGTSTSAYGAGVLLPATYDGTAVVLALRPASGDGEPASVQVLACGSGDLIARTTVNPT